jgi:hypothetical protein
MATVQDPVRPTANRHERFVEQQISQAVRRVRLLDLATAGLGLLIMALAYGLAMILLDRWLNFSQSFRAGSLFVFVAAAAAYTWFILLRPVRFRVNPYYAARQVEDTIPDAKNSLVNWLDLHDENLPQTVKSAIGERAAADLKETDVQQAIRGNHLTWLGTAAIALGVAALAALAVMRPDQFFSLAQRAFNPFEKQGIAKQTTVKVISPEGGNAIVPVNQSVLITVAIAGRIPAKNQADSPRLLLRYNSDGSKYEEFPLEFEGDNTEWSLRIRPHQVQNGFWYRVAGGDDLTPEFRVQVRSNPLLNNFEVTYTYRDYLKFEPRHDTRPNLEAIRGTNVRLIAYANRAVRDGRLVVDGEAQIAAKTLHDQPTALVFDNLIIEKDAKYRIFFTTSEGETNVDPLPYTIKAVPDRAPEVELSKPEELNLPQKQGDFSVPANGLLKWQGVARDDFGITKVTMRMKWEGQEIQPKEYREKNDFRLVNGSYMRQVEFMDNVDLGKLKTSAGLPATLKTGDVLEFWIEAEDNCDFPKPNVGSTKRYRIVVAPPRKDHEDEKNSEKAAADQDKAAHEKKQDGQREKENEEIRKAEAENQNKPGDQKNPEKSDADKKIDEMLKKEMQEQQNNDQQPQANPSDNKGQAKPDPAEQNANKNDAGQNPNKDPNQNKNDAGQNPNKDPNQNKNDAGQNPNQQPKNDSEANPDKNQDAQPKGSERKNGNAPGDKNQPPNADANPDKGESKPAGENKPDPSGKGDKKPMNGAAGQQPGEAKDQAKPDKPMPGGMGEGANPDQKQQENQKQDPGQAKGQPEKKPDQPMPGQGEPNPMKNPNGQPGEGGMGEAKPDQKPKGQQPKEKDGPPKPNEGAGQNEKQKPEGNPKSGEGNPAKGKPSPKAEAKPKQDNGKEGNPNGQTKPGDKNDPNGQSNAGETKPMPKDKDQQGNGQAAPGEPKPEQTQGNPEQNAKAGEGGKDDVAKMKEQLKNGDQEAREQARQKLEEMAKNNSKPQQQKAAQDALKEKGNGQQQSAKNEPGQPKPNEGNATNRQQQPMGDNKPNPGDAKNPGETKPKGSDPHKGANSEPKPSEQANQNQAKNKPSDPNQNSDKQNNGAGAGQAKRGDGNPLGNDQQADAKRNEQVNDAVKKAMDKWSKDKGDQVDPQTRKDVEDAIKDMLNGKSGEPKPGAKPDPQKRKMMEEIVEEMAKDPQSRKLLEDAAKKMANKSGDGSEGRNSRTAGGTPGDGSNMPTRANEGGNSEPEAPGQYTNPNQAFKSKSGDLKLDEFKKRVTKEMLQKYNITEEEWKRHQEAEQRRMRDQANAKNDAPKKDIERGDRSKGSYLNKGASRVETRPDAKPGDLNVDGAGKSPADYEDAAAEYSKKLAESRKKNK